MACFGCGGWIQISLFIVFLASFANSADPNVVQLPEVNGVKLMCPSTVNNDTAVNWKGPDGTQLNFENRTFQDARMSFVDGRDLQIDNAMPSDNGIYTCDNGVQQATVTLTVYVTSGANLLKFKDAFFDSSIGQNQLRSANNVNLTVTCMVMGAFPMPEVSFEIIDHNGTTFETIPASSVTLQSQQEADNTYSVNASIDIEITHAIFNNRKVNCLAKFDVDGEMTTATESAYLYLSPVVPTLFLSSGYRTINPGDNVLTITCHGERGRPGIEAINFYIDGQAVAAPYNFNITPVMCSNLQERDQYYYNMFACNSTLTLYNLTKMDNGKTLNCDYVHEGQTLGGGQSSANQKIDFRFPPTMVNITGNMPVQVSGYTTTALALTCTTDSANGPATLFWYNGSMEINNQQPLSSSPGMYGGEDVSQMLTLSVDRYMDGDVIECRARNFYAPDGITGSVTLNVSYSPEIVQPMVTIYRVYSEEKISIPCTVDAKPMAETKWMHVYSDTNKTEVDAPFVMMSNGNPVLNFEYVTLMHAGKYECMATNGILPSASKAIDLIVLAKSSLAPYTITKVTPSADSIMLEFLKPTDRVIQYMFLQYTKLNALGEPTSVFETEIAIPMSGTTVSVTLGDLSPGSTYQLSLREVDAKYGLVATSFLRTVYTPEADDDDEYTRRDLNIAIIISVLVTAAVVAIMCVIIFLAAKKGGCCNSGSSKYDMQMKPRA